MVVYKKTQNKDEIVQVAWISFQYLIAHRVLLAKTWRSPPETANQLGIAGMDSGWTSSRFLYISTELQNWPSCLKCSPPNFKVCVSNETTWLWIHHDKSFHNSLPYNIKSRGETTRLGRDLGILVDITDHLQNKNKILHFSITAVLSSCYKNGCITFPLKKSIHHLTSEFQTHVFIVRLMKLLLTKNVRVVHLSQVSVFTDRSGVFVCCNLL